MVGAWILASRGAGDVGIERDSIFAFGTAFMWALSAVLTVEALEGLDSPLLGVTLGLLAATAALGGALVARGSLGAIRSIARNTLALKLAAAVLVAFATWFRLLALDETDVAVVLAHEPRRRAHHARARADDGRPAPRAGGRARLGGRAAGGRGRPRPDRARGVRA